MKSVEIIRKRILPYAGTVTVDIGQRVLASDIIAEMDYFPGLVNKLRVSKYLAIKPEKLPEVVTVNSGDLVHKGDILAFDTRWHKPQVLTAPQSGIIGMISRHLGIVYLRKLTKFNPDSEEIHNIESVFNISADQAKKSIAVTVGQQVSPGQIVAQLAWKNNRMRMQNVFTKLFGTVTAIKNNIVTIKNRQMRQQLKAYLAGEVVEVADNWSVTIKAKAHLLRGVYGIAGERSGVLRAIAADRLMPDDILVSDRHKILFVKGVIGRKALQRAAEYSVSAIVAASCSLAVLREYAGTNFIPGITGGEEVKTGVILLKGFSGSSLGDTLWGSITALSDSQVSVNGTTHIRAGAIRPEVLVFQ